MSETAKHEYVWVKRPDRDEWTLHMFPFTLIVEFRPKEPLPYVGSIRGGLCALRGLHSWKTDSEAIAGMIEWGLTELSESYHELLKLRAPAPQDQGGG